MAKIVSHVWSSARGSIAGITYLTTPSGAIIARQRVIPVNAPSPFRTFIKNALSQAASNWDALSVGRKTTWNLWAAANGTLKGRQEFIAGRALSRFVLNSGIAGVVVILDQQFAPTFTGHPVLTLQAAPFTTPADTGVAFKCTVTSPEDCIVVMELSPALSNGRFFWKGPWDTSKSIASVGTSLIPFTISFPALVAGLRYYCRARAFTMDATPAQIGCVVSAVSITYSDAVTNP